VPIAVARAAETATEATKQEDDENYDEDGSERHDLVPLEDREKVVRRQPRIMLGDDSPKEEWRKAAAWCGAL